MFVNSSNFSGPSNYLLYVILSKNGTGNYGTNGKVGKNGTLMLNFPKPQK